MSFKRSKVIAAGSGNLNGATAGTQTGGSTLVMDPIATGSLSCEFDLTAATSTIQLFAEWQVSDDGSTWLDCRLANNAAAVVVTTGTAAIVKVVLAAPDAVYGAKYARAVVRNQVVTGGSSDLYAMKYRFAQVSF